MLEQTQSQFQIFLFEASSRLIVSLVVLVVALVGVRLLRSAVDRLVARALAQPENLPRERQLQIQTLGAVITASCTIALLLVAVLTVLGQFTEIGPLLAGAGVVGLAIGLGAQSFIRDVIGGFFILFENQFGVGDVIRVNDQYAGFVEHIDLRRTVLRNLDGWVITIPNGEIKVVANLTRGWSRMVVDVAVAYKENTDHVIEVLQQVSDQLMAETDIGPLLLEPPQILGVESLGQNEVTIRVLLKTEPMKQWEVGRRYRAMVKKTFDREGIEIPLPHRVVLLRSEGDDQADGSHTGASQTSKTEAQVSDPDTRG